MARAFSDNKLPTNEGGHGGSFPWPSRCPEDRLSTISIDHGRKSRLMLPQDFDAAHHLPQELQDFRWEANYLVHAIAYQLVFNHRDLTGGVNLKAEYLETPVPGSSRPSVTSLDKAGVIWSLRRSRARSATPTASGHRTATGPSSGSRTSPTGCPGRYANRGGCDPNKRLCRSTLRLFLL